MKKIESNVIYGMYSGLALLMDTYHPKEPNGYGTVFVRGCGNYSPLTLDAKPLKESIHMQLNGLPLVEAGYTVFAINHRTMPRFAYPALVDDGQRAVRFIRHHADRFGINPDRIGAVGGSSGGYLVNMLGLLDGDGDPDDVSPVNRESAKVQCVISRASIADLFALDNRGASVFLGGIRASRDSDPKSEEYKRFREASPITHVTPDDPPFLLLHGDADPVVPFEQSEMLRDALQKAGVEVELLPIPGGGHGPAFDGASDPPDYHATMINWLDRHLRGIEEE